MGGDKAPCLSEEGYQHCRVIILFYDTNAFISLISNECYSYGNDYIDLNLILRKLIDNVGNTSVRPGISRSNISAIITSAGIHALPRNSTCYKLSLSSTISKDRALITEILRDKLYT